MTLHSLKVYFLGSIQVIDKPIVKRDASSSSWPRCYGITKLVLFELNGLLQFIDMPLFSELAFQVYYF